MNPTHDDKDELSSDEDTNHRTTVAAVTSVPQHVGAMPNLDKILNQQFFVINTDGNDDKNEDRKSFMDQETR